MPKSEVKVTAQFVDDLVSEIENKLRLLADYAYVQRARAMQLEKAVEHLRVEKNAITSECFRLRQQLDLPLTDKG